jgi:hypothetical protein
MSSPATPPSSGSNPPGGHPSSGTRGAGSGAFDAAFELAAIYDRLRKLEAGTSTNKDHWYSSGIVSTVLSGIILAVFGFFLTGRLEQATKERELNTQSATEMQGLLVKISTGNGAEAQAAAVSLATYGRYSIPPLIENLLYGPERALAAERGLEALSLTDANDVCSDLATVLENRTQRYTAASHSSVIRILGSADCRAAIPAMERYADMIKRADTGAQGLIEYQQAVRDATPSNVTQAKDDLKNTFRLLHVEYAL